MSASSDDLRYRIYLYMYEFNTRTRYSEYDENNRIRLLALLNYLQNTSSYHSFDSGLSVDHYKEIKRSWLMNYWDIYIEALPEDSSYITIGTSPHDIKGLFAYRNFWIKDSQSGKYYVKADSAWFEVNTDTMCPLKPTPDDIAPFGEIGNVLGLNSDTRKVRLEDISGFTKITELNVDRSMLDTNHHVNNIQYISIGFETMYDAGFVTPDEYPNHIRVEYKHAATLHDKLVIYSKCIASSENERTVQTAIHGTDGTEYCNIEYTLKHLI